nr:methyltransferase domain-containing protein [Nocardia mexicana]
MPDMDGWGGQASTDRRAGAGLGGAGARKRHGRHYTPERLARFLAERLVEHVVPQGELRVLDPACGDGELLLAVNQAAAQRFPGLRVRLVGFDLHADAIQVARERAGGLGIDWHTGDFLCAAEDLANESFDVVITNPPYVRTQQLGGATARLLSQRYGLRGRIDLTHPFVATVPRLLRPGGVLGLLCANRFLTTKAGANLRALLRAEMSPVELYDLGDTKLFEAAVLPAITVAVRTRPVETCRYVSAYELDTAEKADGSDLFAALSGPTDSLVTHCGRAIAVEVGTLAPTATARGTAAWLTEPPLSREWPLGNGSESATSAEELPGRRGVEATMERRDSVRADGAALEDPGAGYAGDLVGSNAMPADPGRVVSVDGDERTCAAPKYESLPVDASVPWRMSRPGRDAWLRRVGERTWRTFGEVARIRVGIKTTADRVFISDCWEERDPRPESELLFDLLTHHDLAPWRITRTSPRRVLYPYDVTRSRRTPIDLGEFPAAAAYLAEHKDTLAARDYVTAGGREWFEIWVPQRPHLWSRPKLVFPDISVRPRFALDRSGAIVNGDCYWISLPDIGDDLLAYLLMGVANSTLGLRFYDAVCGNRLYAGRRRWITQYVGRLPLPDPATPAAVALGVLVGECIDSASNLDQDALDELVSAAFALDPGVDALAFGPG